MKRKYYAETIIRYYDMKVKKIKSLLEIPEQENIVFIEQIDERLVVRTHERTYDVRNIKQEGEIIMNINNKIKVVECEIFDLMLRVDLRCQVLEGLLEERE